MCELEKFYLNYDQNVLSGLASSSRKPTQSWLSLINKSKVWFIFPPKRDQILKGPEHLQFLLTFRVTAIPCFSECSLQVWSCKVLSTPSVEVESVQYHSSQWKLIALSASAGFGPTFVTVHLCTCNCMLFCVALLDMYVQTFLSLCACKKGWTPVWLCVGSNWYIHLWEHMGRVGTEN